MKANVKYFLRTLLEVAIGENSSQAVGVNGSY